MVVLPLVAEISTLPRARRAPRSPIASGASLISSRPGALVPPPPRRRETRPDATRERELGGRDPRHQPPEKADPACAGVSIVTAPDSARTRTGSSPIGSPSAYIVNGRSALSSELAGAKDLHSGIAHVRSLEHLRQNPREERELADAFEHHDLEHAVVEHRIRCRVHATAVGLGVGGADRCSREDAALARRVELDLEPRRPPGYERPSAP